MDPKAEARKAKLILNKKRASLFEADGKKIQDKGQKGTKMQLMMN